MLLHYRNYCNPFICDMQKFDAYGCDVCPGGCKSSGGGAGGIEGGIGIAIMVL